MSATVGPLGESFTVAERLLSAPIGMNMAYRDEERAWKDLAGAHWKIHREAAFPVALKGRIVEGYDCEALSCQANSYLVEIFEKNRLTDTFCNRLADIHPKLVQIASALEGDEWQYFWRLAEMTKWLSNAIYWVY